MQINLRKMIKKLIRSNRNTDKRERVSLLYKPQKQQNTTVEIKQENGKVILDFYVDGGKHGTDEMLDGYKLTPARLLQILQDRKDYTETEL